MRQKTKRIGLLLLIGALLSIILLTASLSNLQLQPGIPFQAAGNTDDAREPLSSISPRDTLSMPVLRGVFALFFLILLIYVPTRLVVFVNIKKLFPFILVMIVLFGLVALMPRMVPGESTYAPAQSTEVLPLPADSHPIAPIGQPPQALNTILIIAAVLGIALLGFILVRQSLSSTKVEYQLMQEAEDAISALIAGDDFRSVIIRCYVQMTHALQKEQGIERNDHMTAREFEDLLADRGFPANPVHQLTSLFENVRYGQAQINKQDESTAIQSLNEIIHYCQTQNS
jgi:hypothetical protein